MSAQLSGKSYLGRLPRSVAPLVPDRDRAHAVDLHLADHPAVRFAWRVTHEYQPSIPRAPRALTSFSAKWNRLVSSVASLPSAMPNNVVAAHIATRLPRSSFDAQRFG